MEATPGLGEGSQRLTLSWASGPVKTLAKAHAGPPLQLPLLGGPLKSPPSLRSAGCPAGADHRGQNPGLPNLLDMLLAEGSGQRWESWVVGAGAVWGRQVCTMGSIQRNRDESEGLGISLGKCPGD